VIPDELLALLLSVCQGCANPLEPGHSCCRYCEDDDADEPCVCAPRQDED
jgi:hypothetical protein